MDIESKKYDERSDSDDSWDPEENFEQNSNKKKPSLFQKITVKFDDRAIEKNLDAECEKPILNSTLFPYENEDQDEEMNCEETKAENYPESEKMGCSEKVFMESENDPKHKKNKFGSTENEEALFNVIEDEENEAWMRKKVKTTIETIGNKKEERPLTCPQCFTQVCYVYELIKESIKDISTENQNEKKYKTKEVDNVIVHEHKVIRNRFCTEKMEQKSNRFKENLSELYSKELEIYEDELKTRYEDINVKILISCEGCGLELGYWNVNQEVYILFNVI